MGDRLITVRQAADVLGVQPRTLYKWAWQRRLPIVKIGRLTRVRASDVQKMLDHGSALAVDGRG
jgi:excisionase family DNA binding protein